MRRRILFSLVLAGTLVLAGFVVPAEACHFNVGVGCTGPENQPFNPQVAMSLANNRAGANSDVTTTITQAAHEQFLAKIVSDFPPEAGVDLDKPAFNEKIADVTIRASLNGVQTDLTGRIRDHNDPGHGHPAGGVYHWVLEIDPSAPGQQPTFVDLSADKNSADGHFRFVFDAPQSLIDQAETVDASVTRIETKFLANLSGGAWLTNPAVGGNYTASFFLKAWDANGDGQSAERTRTVTITILGPESVAVAPSTSTKRVGESHSVTATVRDQNGNTMSGIGVTFQRTGANPGSETKTADSGGQATHTYTGANAGNDAITATATLASDSASGSATATWYVPQASTLTLEPASATKAVGQSHTLTATVKDQQGRALAGVTVHFDVTGANAASGDRTTDANGFATFSYTGTNAGDDTVTATTASLSATATVTWTEQQQCAQNDFDCDGLPNNQDNCWHVANPDQADNDGDGFGNACDSDDDNDSLQDAEEGPNGCNPFVRDTDGDGLNDWQEVKGYKTNCADADTDDDGLTDGQETQMGTKPTDPDTDDDGVPDGADNCPTISNPDQKDSDGDGKGDRCDGISISVGT